MNKLFIIGALFALAFCQSCATIFSGSRQGFSISSSVDSSSIVISDINRREVFTGKTPAAVKLKRSSSYFQKAEYSVLIAHEGYQSQTIPIKFKINGWYWGNILIGGLAGMVGVDPGTGAMWTSKTKEVKAILEKAR